MVQLLLWYMLFLAILFSPQYLRLIVVVVYVVLSYLVLSAVLATDRNNSRVFYQCEVVLQAEK